MVTTGQVSVASYKDAQASQGLTAAGREAGMGKQVSQVRANWMQKKMG